MQITGAGLDLQLTGFGHTGIVALRPIPGGVDFAIGLSISDSPLAPAARVNVRPFAPFTQQIHRHHRKLQRGTAL